MRADRYDITNRSLQKASGPYRHGKDEYAIQHDRRVVAIQFPEMLFIGPIVVSSLPKSGALDHVRW